MLLEWCILNFSELSGNKPFNLCLLKHPPELCLRKECCRNAAGLRNQSNASKNYDSHMRISRRLETGQKQIRHVGTRYRTNMDKHGQTWTNMDKHGQTWTNMDKQYQPITQFHKHLHRIGTSLQQVGLRMPLGTSQHLLSPAQFKLRVLLDSQSFSSIRYAFCWFCYILWTPLNNGLLQQSDGTWWDMMGHDGTWWDMMGHDGTWWLCQIGATSSLRHLGTFFLARVQRVPATLV